MVIYSFRLNTSLVTNIKVNTIAKPEKIAPATKYGGKIVVCHPGITEVAKSNDTIVCTDNTSGVLSPARTSERLSCLCQCFVLPVHPNDAIPYNNFLSFVLALSLTVARSGNRPEYQNNKETVK